MNRLVDRVLSVVSQDLNKTQPTSVILTGGRSAYALYSTWSADPSIDLLECANLFFGDERCVAQYDSESNYRIAMEGFSSSISSSQIFRIIGETPDPFQEAERYSKLLPNSVDLIFLSVGEDGHIASIFPYSAAMQCEMKMAYISDSPKSPSERITITPNVIINAKHVIVMAVGHSKGHILAEALSAPEDINELPVRITIGRTWVLDEEASEVFCQHAPKDHHNTKIIYV